MLIAFDLDGTLIEAREIHFSCFNDALVSVGYEPISHREHLSHFDGLPTKKKLSALVSQGRVRSADVPAIVAEKDRLTALRIVPDGPSERITDLFTMIRTLGHMTAVVSNAKRVTVEAVLAALEISPDIVIGNEDVTNPKPDPEGYFLAARLAGIAPRDTIVFEDAPVGKRAARSAGMWLIPVFDPEQLTTKAFIDYMFKNLSSIDVVIPMAGLGRRFKEKGYALPKPLIDVDGEPMIGAAIRTLGIPEARHILLPAIEHLQDDEGLRGRLDLMARNTAIRAVQSLTEGQACTVLLARDCISDRPLVIANCDQVLRWDPDAALHKMVCENLDGLVLTFSCPTPDKRWSYVEVGDDGMVIRSAEKDPISDRALCGVFVFRRGTDIVAAIDEMIMADDRVNGEFYVAPALNRMVAKGARIAEVPVEFHSLGTPELLEEYLRKNLDL